MKHFCFILLCWCTMFSFSQSKPFKISGKITSNKEKMVLESATVYLERLKDSTLVTYTISDENGNFTLEGKTYDKDLNLFISYVGYKTYKKMISINKKEIVLDTINMETDANVLDEVVITSRAPITIKKDTLEFNVKSFKTKKDANVEDLLKKLPGVEVLADGKIKVNGREVNKILVNGKPFFGNDPTITTRSLTKDIIEKVQITDTKSKAQAFTGEESEGTEKTINLTIKKENNKGVFGRLAAAGGTDKRYELSGMFNWFDSDRRVSVMSGKNNVNSSGFNSEGIGSMQIVSGGVSVSRGASDGSNGLTTSDDFAVNFVDKWDNIDVSANYQNSGSTTENESISNRENILADSRYFSNSDSKSFNERRRNRTNLEFETKIDSTLSINIQPSFNSSRNISISDRNQESLDALNQLTNNSTNNSFNSSTSNGFSNRFDINKRFKKKGAYISLGINNNINTNKSSDILDSKTNFYDINSVTNQPGVRESIIRKQITNGDSETIGFSTNLRYSTPLINEKLFLNSGVKYSRNKQKNVRSTFDFDEVLQDYNYNKLNKELSTDTEYVNEESNTWVGLRLKKEKWSLIISGGYVFRTLKNKDGLRSMLNDERQFKALETNSRFRYRFNPKMSFSMDYALDNKSPELSQMQAFENVSNPLNTIIGNPNLEPTNTHRIRGNIQNYNFQKGVGFFGFFQSSIVKNQIVTKTNIDPETLKRETTYANVNGNINFNANISVMKSVKLDTLRTLKFNMSIGHGKTKRVNFNNDVKYTSNNVSFSPNLNVALSWKDIIDIETNYSLSYNNTKFDLDTFKTQNFLVHIIGISTSTTFLENLEWENNISYSYNSQIADGFQKSAWFWNATATYSMFKDKGFLSLKVYDVLNQNTNARRIATANYIEDLQSTVLNQYFMLGFSWKFNSLGKRGEQRHYERRNFIRVN